MWTSSNTLGINIDGYQLDENEGRSRVVRDFSDKYNIKFTNGKFCRYDFTATDIENPSNTFVGEVKCYHKNPRPYTKYPDYQIDYDKLESICKAADEQGAQPVLIVYFSDIAVLWNLNNFDWRSTKKWKNVNKDGQNWGKEKERALQVYLRKENGEWWKEMK